MLLFTDIQQDSQDEMMMNPRLKKEFSLFPEKNYIYDNVYKCL